MISLRFVLAWLVCLGSVATGLAGERFLEKDGIVSIEAEHPTERQGNWDNVQGAMTIKAGAYTSHLRYAIYFSQPGKYSLWLLGRAGTAVDEMLVLFREEDAPSTNRALRNVTLPEEHGWSADVPSVTVRRPGWHRLLLVQGKAALHRREGSIWQVDKIVLAREPAERPSGEGPEETVSPPRK